MNYLCVGIGGAFGALLRYIIGLVKISENTAFPYKTLIINIVGSFAIGLIASLTAKGKSINPDLILFLKVGLCGGFTTFSTFALESAELIGGGKNFYALLYVALSVVLSLVAIRIAQIVVR